MQATSPKGQSVQRPLLEASFGLPMGPQSRDIAEPFGTHLPASERDWWCHARHFSSLSSPYSPGAIVPVYRQLS